MAGGLNQYDKELDELILCIGLCCCSLNGVQLQSGKE